MKILILLITITTSTVIFANDKQQVLKFLKQQQQTNADTALQLWDFAELGYLEHKSSNLLQTRLKKAGFKIESAVADIPTAFIASFGSGGPVIGILAEFDALPGISQSASPFREVIKDKNSGHACGHHLFGVGSVAAAIALAEWLQLSNHKATIRLYGTPAEEGGSGKVYMVRAGLFDDADIVMHWHPGDNNNANPATTLANRSARFKFKGISAHAAAAPERGRSALDGVEAMNMMVNLMREHIDSDARIHYVITEGGYAPNVVPDSAVAYYYVRHPKVAGLKKIWQRVEKAAQGAALGTGTKLEIEIMHGNNPLLPNTTLANLMHKNMLARGGIKYNKKQLSFAKTIAKSFSNPKQKLGSEATIMKMKLVHSKGSTDVGDVSQVVPVAGFRTATWVPGTAAHSWQAIAAGGSSIGIKGMQLAAEVLAMTAVDLILQPEFIKKAKAELQQRQGKNFKYQALLGDRKPPLDYRK